MLATSLIQSGGQNQPIPTFPKDFYVSEQTNLAISQGGYSTATGTCCSKDSPQCKVQTIIEGSDVREQGTKNRTRADSPEGIIINWFGGGVAKQMAMLPGSQANSTHDLVCGAYCPLDGDFMSDLQIGDGKTTGPDKVKDLGQVTITSMAPGAAPTTCEQYEWTEHILGVVKMEETSFYVDFTKTPPEPYYSTQLLEPFGQPLGDANLSFAQFTPGDVSDHFDIDMDSIASCEMSQNCNGNSAAHLSALLAAQHRLLHKNLLQVAQEAVQAGETSARVPPPAWQKPRANVTFPKDYTTHEENRLVINQGGTPQPGGDFCCEDTTLGQCQIQAQALEGLKYFDFTNQRLRFEDELQHSIEVDDYKAGKAMLVNVTGGVETCQEYCPIEAGDTMEPFGIDPDAKDLGKGPAPVSGGWAEHFQWSEVILKVIKMQTTDFYAKLGANGDATPLEDHTAITPFGKTLIGWQNRTFDNFAAGTPPAAKFDIAGVDVCPRSANCGQQSKQLSRLAKRQLHTFARYHMVPAAVGGMRNANGVVV